LPKERFTVNNPVLKIPEHNLNETGESPVKSRRYAWYVTIVLMLCYTFSFVDRQILGLLVSPIKADLGISDAKIGLLQGLSFALFYATMALPLGRLADRSNRRNLIAVCIMFWSLFTAACAVARSYAALFLTRMGVGVGEAGLNPAAFSMLSDYFPKERLGTAISVFYIGQLLGAGLALIIGGTVVQAVAQQPDITLPILGSIASWRITFLIIGIPGLLFAVLVYTIREPLRTNLARDSSGNAAMNLRATFRQMGLRWQSVAGISMAFLFQAACNYGFSAWIPTHFLRAYGWNIGETGRALGSIILPFGCLGLYLGGYLSERWQQQGKVDGPLLVAIPSAIGIILFLVPALLMPTAAWSLALVGPGFFFLVLPMGTSSAALQIIFPNQVRAQVGALYLFILNLGGLTLGPYLPGVFSDYFFRNPKMIGASTAITMTIAAVFMLIVISAARKPYREHFQQMHSATG
jgi:MFS family permease